MPLDPSISLQTQTPDPRNFISGFLDLGAKKLSLDKARATYDADVAQRQAESSSSQSAATVNAANVNPLIQQQAANTGVAQTQLNEVQLANARKHAENIAQQMDVLRQKPDLSRDDIVNSVVQSALTNNAPNAAILQALQGIPDKGATPDAYKQFVVQSLTRAQQVSQHLNTIAPTPTFVNQGQQANPVASGNPMVTGVAPGTPQGTPVPLGITPSQAEEVQTDAQGNRFIVQRGPRGEILATRPVPGSTTGAPAAGGGAPTGPVNLPPNETPQTRDALQAERGAVQAQVTNSGQMHQINRDVYSIADSGVQTGKLGGVINRLSSAIGYNLGEGEATDYNTLGKMLARSNQQLAQSMGPHTNAGLAQQEAAGGTTDYDKNTIKKIASLNDALVTGVQMYQKGLENAISTGGIFAKRQFDQQWGSTMDPDALRLKNAVDNGNKGQIEMILKEVGGKGSPGAIALGNKLKAIRSLAGEQ